MLHKSLFSIFPPSKNVPLRYLVVFTNEHVSKRENPFLTENRPKLSYTVCKTPLVSFQVMGNLKVYGADILHFPTYG